MTIKDFVSNLNIGEDALILIFVIGSAWMQMKRVEEMQHSLEKDFAKYIDNASQVQAIANDVLRWQEVVAEKDLDYRSLYDQYTNQKNYAIQLEKQVKELKKELEQKTR